MKKTIIITICLLTIGAFKIQSQTTLATDLVSYWNLDEISGSVVDAVNMNPGTVNGATANLTGLLNKAYSFDGTNDYISVTNSESLNIQSNAISLSAWVKPSAAKTEMIVSKISGIGAHISPYFQYNLQLHYSGGKLYPRFFLAINGSPVFAANTTSNLTLGEWYHIAGTYDGTTMRIYLNGSQIATQAVTGNITGYATPVYFGINGALGEALSGMIDEVGIWKRMLEPSEVNTLYNSNNGISYPFGLPVYNYSAIASPVEGGTVTKSPPGESYPSGTRVTLTQTVNSGYSFIGWNGQITTNPYTVTVTQNSGIGAIYTQTSGNYVFHTGINPSGAGTITPSNGTYYVPGSTLLVSATPANSDYFFSDWEPPHNGKPNPFNLVMNSDNAVVAKFIGLPVVETTANVTSITQNSANSGGNVLSNGNNTLKARGVCWNTTGNPTVDDSKTSNGTSTGTFTSLITELRPGTLYYIRAYATNNYGTSYGSVVTCTTEVATPATWWQSGTNVYYAGGHVGIGTETSFSGAMLTVNGKILAKEIEVLSEITSDFVFEPEYELMPLTELEIYVRQHKHLPGIPSAAEFAKEGQNLGKMDDLLLRKIEELTLYLIRQDHQFQEQNKSIEDLAKEVNLLKNTVK